MAVKDFILDFSSTDTTIEEVWTGEEMQEEFRYPVFSQYISESGNISTPVIGANYDFDLSFGLDARIDRPTLGSFSSEYPIRTAMLLPDSVTPGSSASIGTDGRVNIMDAKVDMSSLSVGELAFDLWAESDGVNFGPVTVGDFWGFDGFDTGVELSFEGFKRAEKEVLNLDLSTDIEAKIGDFSFTAGLPGGSEVSGSPLRFSGNLTDPGATAGVSSDERIFTVSADVVSLLGKLPVPGAAFLKALSGSFGPVSFGGFWTGGKRTLELEYDILSAALDAGYSLVQNVSVIPETLSTTYNVLGQTFSGDLGDTFSFNVPETHEGPVTGEVTYDFDADLEVAYSLVPFVGGSASALGLKAILGAAGDDDSTDDDPSAEGKVEGPDASVTVGSLSSDGKSVGISVPPLWSDEFQIDLEAGKIPLITGSLNLPDDFFAPITQDFVLDVVGDGGSDAGNIVFSEDFETDPGWTYRAHSNALPGNTVEHRVEDGNGYMEIAVEDTTAPWYNVVESPAFARQSSERGFTVEFRINPIDPAYAVHPGLMLSDGIEFAPKTQIYNRAEFQAGEKNDNFNFALRHGSETDRNRSGSFEDDTWYDVTITSVAGTGDVDVEVLEPDGDVFYETTVALREPLTFDRILIGDTQGGSGKSSSATARIGIDDISIRSGPPAPDTTSELNLNDFTAYGEGDWQLAGDGKSVRQNINAQPTAFVSNDSYINSKFEGSFTVETNRDGDWIGFVFGFGSSPDEDFYVFKWKQDDQQNPDTGYIAREGYEVGRVTGGFDAIVDALWEGRDDAEYQTIATATGSNLGWKDYTTYNFELVYNSDRAEIRLGGADPLGPELSTIFEFRPSDVGLSEFSEGRFGFYNSSQKLVRYNEVSQSASSGTVPTPALLPEPVLELKFDGAAEDTSGNGFDGIVQGASLTKDRFDEAESAYHFDGVNDYIDLPERAFNAAEGTISIWAKPDGDMTGQGQIFSSADFGRPAGTRLYLTFDGEEGVGGAFLNHRFDPVTVSPDTWTHLALTWNSDAANFYVDGSLAETTAGGQPDIERVTLGAYGEGFDNFFQGDLDNVRIYDETLTQDEVLALAEDSVAAPPGDDTDLTFVSGRIHGDPHLETLDGLAYDFQAAGEFILIETEPGAENPFQVQTRFEPWKGSDVVSVTTRMAVEVGDTVVEVDAKGPDKILLDGRALTPAALESGSISLDSDSAPELTFSPDLSSATILLNDTGEKLEIANQRGFLNITTFLTDADGGNAGYVRGLLGDAEQDGTADDLALRDGTVLASRDADTLYGPFADSWRLDGSPDKTALFSNSVSFPDPFPATAVTVEDLPDDRRADAEAKAIGAGLSPGDSRFDAAVLDYALTGEDAFIQGGVSDTPAPEDKLTPAPEDRATATFGVLTDVETITEGDDGSQTIAFEFYRTGDTSAAATLSYAINGDVTAGDLKAGTALSGDISFTPEQEALSLSVDVLGDMEVEPTEALVMEITGTDVTDAGVAMASADVAIATDDFPPEAKDDGPVATDEDTAVTIPEVLANDTDPDDDTLTVKASDAVSARGAAVTDNGDGTFRYDPAGALDDLEESETVTDTFGYTVSDGNGGTDTAVVSISVTGVAEPVLNLVEGTAGRDTLIGTDQDDRIEAGGGVLDTLTGKGGADVFDFSALIGNGSRDVAKVMDFEIGVDILGLAPPDIAASRSFAGNSYLNLAGGENDMVVLQGVGSIDEINYA